MVRKFEERDLEAVMELWLAGNLQAHSFIPEQYWKDVEEFVRSLLPGAALLHCPPADGKVLCQCPSQRIHAPKIDLCQERVKCSILRP